MKRETGNQHSSLKRALLERLHNARLYLQAGILSEARVLLEWYRADYAKAPSSTRRRWKCGR